MIREYSHNK